MSWFKRVTEGITTKTNQKKATPDGLWDKCPRCKAITAHKDMVINQYVCPECNFHNKIGSKEYFDILFDDGKFKELDPNLISGDPLNFSDSKSYKSRILDTIEKTNLKDAVRVGVGKVTGQKIVICCMDFGFIGGSMGSVVGEKIARGIDHARENNIPLLIIS
ncbi:MAG: acetyl-CoA carboxylase carboxyl transferase subunit beta, partial [Bacteroidia bacterium]|nr:acetyl-CoA carboxylase carboxyl transferase subunit beta [Bacteroidia bacterium]